MTVKLYELSTELAKIHDELITADGELSPDLEKRLDEVNLALTQKATGLRRWLVNIDTDIEALDTEIKRLQKIKTVHSHLYERLKTYVHKNMVVADLKKIETPIGVFTVAKNPASLELIPEDGSGVPDEWKTLIPAHYELTSDDKKRIKEAWENGYEVPGTKYITDRTNLRIK
jgi:hypothetical protein